MVLTWKVFCIPASEPICIFNPLTANSCLWLCRADSRFPFCVGWPGRFLSPTDRHGEQGGGGPCAPRGQKCHRADGMEPRLCVCRASGTQSQDVENHAAAHRARTHFAAAHRALCNHVCGISLYSCWLLCPRPAQQCVVQSKLLKRPGCRPSVPHLAVTAISSRRPDVTVSMG